MDLLPTTLTIGHELWFFSMQLDNPRIPRHAIVTGAGAKPGTVDITLLANPVLDVKAGRLSGASVVRNVPVYDLHPRNWKEAQFCVMPGFQIRELGNPAFLEHVDPIAGSITYLDPERVEQLALQVSGPPDDDEEYEEEEEETPAPARKKASKKKVAKKVAKKKSSRKKEPAVEPEPEPVDEPETDAPDEPDPAPDEHAEPALAAFKNHPRYATEIRDLLEEIGVTEAIEGGRLVFASKGKKVQLATVQYISRKPRGYRLRAYRRGHNMDIIVRTANSAPEVGALIGRLAKILEAGQAAKSKQEAGKATIAALKRVSPVE